MIWLIAIVYIIWRIAQLLLHRGQSGVNFTKLVTYFFLELLFAVIGLVGIGFIFAGESSSSLAGFAVIGGAICLIISGRIGLHVRKIAQGIDNQIPVAPTIGQRQLKISEMLTIGMFLIFIMSWPFYEGLAYWIAGIMYAFSIVLGVLAFAKAKKSKTDPATKKGIAWSVMIFNLFFIFLAIVMLISIASKI